MKEQRPQGKLEVQSGKIEAQIVIKDKHGNVKYQGPLVMEVKEKEDVRNS